MLWTRNVALSNFCSLFDPLMGAVSKAVPCGIPDLLMLHVDKQIHFALMLARYVQGTVRTWLSKKVWHSHFFLSTANGLNKRAMALKISALGKFQHSPCWASNVSVGLWEAVF